MDTTIRISIITDKKELNRKGHDKPVIELYNDISCTWISSKNITFEEIEKEIKRIKKTTTNYIKNNYIKKLIELRGRA